jgi:hypothetical protein
VILTPPEGPPRRASSSNDYCEAVTTHAASRFTVASSVVKRVEYPCPRALHLVSCLSRACTMVEPDLKVVVAVPWGRNET